MMMPIAIPTLRTDTTKETKSTPRSSENWYVPTAAPTMVTYAARANRQNCPDLRIVMAKLSEALIEVSGEEARPFLGLERRVVRGGGRFSHGVRRSDSSVSDGWVDGKVTLFTINRKNTAGSVVLW